MPVIAVDDHGGRSRPGLDTARRWGVTLAAPLPLLPRPPSPPARVPDGVALSVVCANLERGTRDPRAQARALVALRADVLLLTEHTSATRDALTDAGIAERLPHRADDAQDDGLDGYFGSLVASRLPLDAARVADLGGRRAQVVDLTVDGAPVRLVPVHTQAPIWDRDVAAWRATIDANAAVADDAPGSVVLAGDWNATGGNLAFRRALARHGLADASAVRGHRWYPTWPVGTPVLRLPLPPFLTLDHVVVSADVEVVALHRLSLPGSDHKGLRAELRFRRAGRER